MGINLEIDSSGKGGAALQTSAVWNDESRLVEQWARVRARLQAEVGEVEYRTWLKQVSFGGLAGDEAVVMLPTRFLRDWVNKEYGELITAFWQAENPAIRNVEIRTGTQMRAAAPSLAE
ncbi:MAG TPA: DnaA N-terminal domain-containing protein, partial [Acidocella sp.]|nr:DnaA N-terminal domain-containing protein [Acidocella sp.]